MPEPLQPEAPSRDPHETELWKEQVACWVKRQDTRPCLALTCSNRPMYRTGSVEYIRLKRARNQPSYRGCNGDQTSPGAPRPAAQDRRQQGQTSKSGTLEVLQASGENELLDSSRMASGLILTNGARRDPGRAGSALLLMPDLTELRINTRNPEPAHPNPGAADAGGCPAWARVAKCSPCTLKALGFTPSTCTQRGSPQGSVHSRPAPHHLSYGPRHSLCVLKRV